MRPTKTAIALLLTLAAASTLGAREFQDQFGRIIEAELVSHTGADTDTVTIRKDGKEMRAKISVFSTADQKVIRDWMKATPPKIDYAFRVSAEKTAEDARRPKSEKVTYDIKLTNLSRHTVGNLKVEYRAYMKDEGGDRLGRGLRDLAVAGFGRRAARKAGFSDEDEPEIKHVEGSVDIAGPMRFNQTANFTTEGLRLDSSRGNWVSDGFKDRLLGVILRVYDPGGKLVFEHRDTKTKDLVWPKPGEEAVAAGTPAEPKVKIE